MTRDEARDAVIAGWQPIETAPRDGRELLMTDGVRVRVCYPKRYPRPISGGDDLTISRAGDVWEFFRDYEIMPNHSWSLVPTYWMPLPAPPREAPPERHATTGPCRAPDCDWPECGCVREKASW